MHVCKTVDPKVMKEGMHALMHVWVNGWTGGWMDSWFMHACTFLRPCVGPSSRSMLAPRGTLRAHDMGINALRTAEARHGFLSFQAFPNPKLLTLQGNV